MFKYWKYLLIGVLTIPLVFISCSKKPTLPLKEAMSSAEVNNFLVSQGVHPILADTKYVLADKDFIKNDFAHYLFEKSAADGVNVWLDNVNDCDDFAEYAKVQAKILHLKTINRRPDAALAVWEFWYKKDNGDDHAIDVWLVRDKGGNLQLFFFEPQSWKEITLSKTEIQSCYFLE